MRIFVFSFHNLWASHYETELEIIQGHLDKGDEMYKVNCKSHLSICDTNIDHDLSECIQCIHTGNCGKKMLVGNVHDLPIIIDNKSIKARVDSIQFKYNSLQELFDINVDNFDIGYASASSLISRVREPDLDVNKHRVVLDKFLRSSLAVYLSALEYFNKYSPDVVYIFNGRLASSRAILRATESKNIHYYVHDRGYNIAHYALFENSTPHNFRYLKERMHALWHVADKESRIKTAEKFYFNNVAGKSSNWFSFVKEQEKGLLPPDWDPAKRNVIIYNSSEDEFASLGKEWKNELYESQFDGIKRIVRDCAQHSDIHFYLRVHPNLGTVYNTQIQKINELSEPNLTVIQPTDPISTYDLLFNCEKVISFGSTVGIEAVFWGKPSIQLGKSLYASLNATYQPNTHDEVIRLVVANLEPKDKEGALMYGFYFNSHGIPFKYYVADNFLNGAYKGVNLLKQRPFWIKVFDRLKRNKISKYFLDTVNTYYKTGKYRLR